MFYKHELFVGSLHTSQLQQVTVAVYKQNMRSMLFDALVLRPEKVAAPSNPNPTVSFPLVNSSSSNIR